MSAQIQSFSAVRGSYRYGRPSHNKDKTTYPEKTMSRFSIVVQPPRQTQVSTWLYPPVIVKQTIRAIESTIGYFVTATLLDLDGQVVDGLLGGTKAVNAVRVDSGREGASGKFQFIFSNLSILHPGEYVIRLDVYVMAEADDSGATLVHQLQTRPVAAFDSEVPDEKPSSDEKSAIQKAKDVGVHF